MSAFYYFISSDGNHVERPRILTPSDAYEYAVNKANELAQVVLVYRNGKQRHRVLPTVEG